MVKESGGVIIYIGGFGEGGEVENESIMDRRCGFG
jgi:hypothetical protein